MPFTILYVESLVNVQDSPAWLQRDSVTNLLVPAKKSPPQPQSHVTYQTRPNLFRVPLATWRCKSTDLAALLIVVE